MRKLTVQSLSDAMTMCSIFQDEVVGIVCGSFGSMTKYIDDLYDVVRDGQIPGAAVINNGIKFQTGSTIRVFLTGTNALNDNIFTGLLYDSDVEKFCDRAEMRKLAFLERPKYGSVQNDDDIEEDSEAVEQFLGTIKINQE